MGFFSQECHGCGASILNPYSCNDINSWMTEAVAITRQGNIHTGTYDGYGRIDGAEYAIGEYNTVWHKACWEVAGKPLDYKGQSKHAQDQGYFFDDDEPKYCKTDPRLEASHG